jgi:hypothetical protein
VPFPADARILDTRIAVSTVTKQLSEILEIGIRTTSDCFALRPRLSAPAYKQIAHHVATAVGAKALELRRDLNKSRRCRLLTEDLPASVPTCVHARTGRQTGNGFSFRVLEQSAGSPILEYRPFAFRIDGTNAVLKDLTTGTIEKGPWQNRIELGGFTAIEKHAGKGADLPRAVSLLLAQNGVCKRPTCEGRLIVRLASHTGEGEILYLPFWEIPVRSTREVVMADTALCEFRRTIRRPVPGAVAWIIRARFHTVGAFFFDAIAGSLVETFPNASFFSETNKASTQVPVHTSCETFRDLARVPRQQMGYVDSLLLSTRGKGLQQTLEKVANVSVKEQASRGRRRASSSAATHPERRTRDKARKTKSKRKQWYWKE